jgi:hypothetical protein
LPHQLLRRVRASVMMNLVFAKADRCRPGSYARREFILLFARVFAWDCPPTLTARK